MLTESVHGENSCVELKCALGHVSRWALWVIVGLSLCVDKRERVEAWERGGSMIFLLPLMAFFHVQKKGNEAGLWTSTWCRLGTWSSISSARASSETHAIVMRGILVLTYWIDLVLSFKLGFGIACRGHVGDYGVVVYFPQRQASRAPFFVQYQYCAVYSTLSSSIVLQYLTSISYSHYQLFKRFRGAETMLNFFHGFHHQEYHRDLFISDIGKQYLFSFTIEF